MRELILIGAMLLLALTAIDQRFGLGRSGRVEAVGGDVLYGPPHVTDGDTIKLNGKRIRIAGVDAPEMSTSVGRAAKSHLIGLIGAGSVSCTGTGERSYDRVVAVCYLPSGEDLAARMVADGWAVDLPRFSGGRYGPQQRRAEADGLGMHAVAWN